MKQHPVLLLLALSAIVAMVFAVAASSWVKIAGQLGPVPRHRQR